MSPMGEETGKQARLGTWFAPSLKRGRSQGNARSHFFRSEPVALPLSRVEPRANRVDHHGRERDLLIERVLAQALMKINRQMNRRLAAPDWAVERTGNQERRQTPSRPARSQRANESGQHRPQPAWWRAAP